MLIAAILLTALAVVLVYIFVRRGNVDPRTWAEQNDVVDDSHDDPETK